MDSLALTYSVTLSITVGETYLFRFKAKNIHGWSPWSDELALVAASVPTKVEPAAVTFNEATDVRISWTQPADAGGVPITEYTISIRPSGGAPYQVDPSCDGADATVMANLFCLVPMANLRAAPFTLGLDELAVVQVTATNEIGTSDPSDANTGGAVVKTEPTAPSAPLRDDAGTSDLQITVSFPVVDSHPDHGGSPITSIALYWDEGRGDGTYTALVGEGSDSLLEVFTVSGGVTRSGLYEFRHRAANIFGWGGYSPAVTITAATKPDVMAAVVTTVTASSKVRFTWVAPDDRGDAIQSYQVLVRASDPSSFLEDTTDCDGSDPTIRANAYCEIPLATLQAGGFTGLAQGDLIVATVSATNAFGTSSAS